MFDANSCKLRLSKDYLVDAYLAGLQDEYVDPICLFKPRTMREACSLARLQEISFNDMMRGKWLPRTRGDHGLDLESISTELDKSGLDFF